MLAILWAKVWKWIVAACALLLAVLAIFYKGKSSGEAKQQTKVDEANQRADIAEQSQKAVETRHDVETEVAKLPEAPAQKVADARVDSAAGQLRDDGWMR